MDSQGIALHDVIEILVSLGSLFGLWSTFNNRFARMEVKVDTMWAFQMRRAEADAIQNGFATRNSPLAISPQVARLFDQFADQLRHLYQRQGRHLSDFDLMLEIERSLGEDLLREVAMPNKMTNGSCIVLAAQLAKTLGSTEE